MAGLAGLLNGFDHSPGYYQIQGRQRGFEDREGDNHFYLVTG